MSGPSTIGALRVVLGLDSAKFTEGLTAAQAHLKKVGRQFEQLGSQMSSLGQSLSIGITAPVLAMGAAALKASSDFESAMIKVKISTKATAEEMAQLETQARAIGKSTIFSAGEAADAMDMLAKTGLTTAEILGGAAKATVDLAAATGSELEPAAAAVSDSMKQFKIDASALPAVVNQITGAVNESKLDFKDFQLAMGQAGGVAAGLGVSFEDFNAVLAATSSNFASGSDAGTSFKTFLTRMVPTSKAAANAMSDYGISFFDAQGGMKSMSDIAEMLRTKLGGLDDQAKTDVLTKIFGTDAMRTGMGLMEQGAAGIDRVREALLATDAAAQSAERMKGFAGQMEELKGSLEELGIAIGKSGLLEFATQLVTGLGGLIDRLSASSPELLKFGTIAAAVAAAIGPLVMAAGAAVSAIGAVMGVLAAPAAVPIIATVAGVAAAFMVFKDTLIPLMQEFGARVAEVLGPKLAPIFEAMKGLVTSLAELFAGTFGPDTQLGQDLRGFGEVIVRVWGASLDVITGAIKVITNVVKALGALLRGDFAGAWTYVGAAMWEALKGLGNAFATIFPELVSWSKRAYEGIREWLGTLLPRIFETVKSKIREVGDVFFELYDRVVGHSYVPDMVEGVAAWMAKLDAGMVKPAKDATKKTAEAFKDLRDDVARIMEGVLTDSEKKLRDYKANVLKIREAIAAGVPGAEGLLDAYTSHENGGATPTRVRPPGSNDDIKNRAEEANKIWTEAVEERERIWDESLGRMGSSFKGMFQEWVSTGKVNWKRLLLDMLDNFDGLMSALKKSGSGLGEVLSGALGKAGGGLGSVLSMAGRGVSGAMAGMAVGQGLGLGTGNSGIDTGLSLGGSIAGGMLAGSSLAGTIGAGIANGLAGLGASTALAGSMGVMLSSAAVLGPIGAIVALAAGALLKSKPSNNAALATFDESGAYSVSGNKRTDETTSAATAAANAIQAGQAALKAFGITLGTTVRQIDIGTRDLTHVFLSTGQEIRTAVGDPAAAAEAGLRAVLEGATYTDEAQKSLVQSMLAAGKGFDEISVSLQAFAQAQLIPKTLADQIAKLTDPAAFDTKALVAEQQARRAEMKAQLDAGLLTAQQFASIGAQLTELEGLELGQLVEQMNQVAKSDAAVEKARSALQAAYQKSASDLKSVISSLRSAASSLATYATSLRGDLMADAAPEERFEVAGAEFARVAALAQLGNVEALGDLERVSEAWRKASLDYQGDALSHLKVVGTILNAVQAAGGTADRQATLAERQLAADEAQVNALLGVQEAVLDLPEAIAGLLKAQSEAKSILREWGANPESNQALAAATGYTGDFGKGGWQAWILQQDEATKAVARHILGAFGQTERIVGFATGGSFKVGGSGGIDSQLMQFRATPGEMVQVSRPGQGDDAANAVRQLTSELMPAVRAIASAQVRLETRVDRMVMDGVFVRGEDVEDPVSVKAVA